jgi:hypothetical protein
VEARPRRTSAVGNAGTVRRSRHEPVRRGCRPLQLGVAARRSGVWRVIFDSGCEVCNCDRKQASWLPAAGPCRGCAVTAPRGTRLRP